MSESFDIMWYTHLQSILYFTCESHCNQSLMSVTNKV